MTEKKLSRRDKVQLLYTAFIHTLERGEEIDRNYFFDLLHIYEIYSNDVRKRLLQNMRLKELSQAVQGKEKVHAQLIAIIDGSLSARYASVSNVWESILRLRQQQEKITAITQHHTNGLITVHQRLDENFKVMIQFEEAVQTAVEKGNIIIVEDKNPVLNYTPRHLNPSRAPAPTQKTVDVPAGTKLSQQPVLDAKRHHGSQDWARNEGHVGRTQNEQPEPRTAQEEAPVAEAQEAAPTPPLVEETTAAELPTEEAEQENAQVQGLTTLQKNKLRIKHLKLRTVIKIIRMWRRIQKNKQPTEEEIELLEEEPPEEDSPYYQLFVKIQNAILDRIQHAQEYRRLRIRLAEEKSERIRASRRRLTTQGKRLLAQVGAAIEEETTDEDQTRSQFLTGQRIDQERKAKQEKIDAEEERIQQEKEQREIDAYYQKQKMLQLVRAHQERQRANRIEEKQNQKTNEMLMEQAAQRERKKIRGELRRQKRRRRRKKKPSKPPRRTMFRRAGQFIAGLCLAFVLQAIGIPPGQASKEHEEFQQLRKEMFDHVNQHPLFYHVRGDSLPTYKVDENIDFRWTYEGVSVVTDLHMPSMLIEAYPLSIQEVAQVMNQDDVLKEYSYRIAQGIIDWNKQANDDQLQVILIDENHGKRGGAVFTHGVESEIADIIREHIIDYFSLTEEMGSGSYEVVRVNHDGPNPKAEDQEKEQKKKNHVTEFIMEANEIYDGAVPRGELTREEQLKKMRRFLYISIHLDDLSRQTIKEGDYRHPLILLHGDKHFYTNRKGQQVAVGKRHHSDRNDISVEAARFIEAQMMEFYLAQFNSFTRQREQNEKDAEWLQRVNESMLPDEAR